MTHQTNGAEATKDGIDKMAQFINTPAEVEGKAFFAVAKEALAAKGIASEVNVLGTKLLWYSGGQPFFLKPIGDNEFIVYADGNPRTINLSQDRMLNWIKNA